MKKMLAERTKMIDSSGIRKVFALAGQLDDPVDFSIGQPDFDVPQELKDKAIEAIRSGQNKYTQTAGNGVLKQKVAGRLRAELGWQKPEVLITSGVSGGLLLAFMSLVDPGDEVIVPDPYFVIYKHLVNMLGGKCVFVDSYPDFELPVQKICEAITERTKLILVNSPCNPTGAVYAREQMTRLAKIADDNNIIVISDEIYKKFCYDGEYSSMACFCDNIILLRGFSKSYAMTGWRLGFAAANEKLNDVIEQMIKIQQYTFVCAPAPFQQAAINALDYGVKDYVDIYRNKRNFIYDGLKGRFDIVRPAGAFYFFVKVPGSEGAAEFVKRAIAENVLIIPGNVFSERDTHFRISFATSDEKIRQGVEILRRLV
ncbi:MAG: aminotransferase class I/II-fold pyridoxal phosphate-dependent enzyme [Sedimentisphaerales bacterium]|nr:aminotransferase class I/II-fold pyridoxal phosphate-dependent enzyme [Sedimentisphaerales bacterium]